MNPHPRKMTTKTSIQHSSYAANNAHNPIAAVTVFTHIQTMAEPKQRPGQQYVNADTDCSTDVKMENYVMEYGYLKWKALIHLFIHSFNH